MGNRKAKLRRHRRRVDRTERVKPPPEAAQHLRAWPMQTLLAAGHPAGIDAQEFESALQIVETFRVLTSELGMRGAEGGLERGSIGAESAKAEMSDRDAERCACWFEWALRLPVGLPTRLVAWIEDELPIVSVDVLRRACRLWDKVRGDRASDNRPRRVDSGQTVMVTLPALRDVPAAMVLQRPLSFPLPAMTMHSEAAHAYAARAASTTRARRGR